MNVAVLGASNKPERYRFKAVLEACTLVLLTTGQFTKEAEAASAGAEEPPPLP
jgi:hypothetical protein